MDHGTWNSKIILAQQWQPLNRRHPYASGAIYADLSRAGMSPRTTSCLFGGPINAAAWNGQQRSDHYGAFNKALRRAMLLIEPATETDPCRQQDPMILG
jgi:hypothetical protein